MMQIKRRLHIAKGQENKLTCFHILCKQEMEAPKFRGSLPVPNVQELAKKPMYQVPPRYVRTDLVDPFSLLLAILPCQDSCL
ncbi:hypothetical protein AKJ16_DCAP26179 [Drosera capensis]